jgi:hypothetical protein
MLVALLTVHSRLRYNGRLLEVPLDAEVAVQRVFCCEVSAVAIARNEFHDEFEAF